MQKDNILKYADYLVSWIQKEVKKANWNGVIIGMSGGVDSSVVAMLAKKAFPNNSLGVFLPIDEMGKDLEDAKLVAKKINIETKLIDLSSAFKSMQKVLKIKDKCVNANIKPRLRMSALYALAQKNNFLVLGTDNAAEWIVGYFTKYGDGGVDLLPIIHLNKGQVKELAQKFDLPKNIYIKKSSAGLWENQSIEKELGFSYNDVDNYILNRKMDKQIFFKIQKQKEITSHKRKPIPIPKKFKYNN